MSITISTSKFEASHGKKPRGTGSWAFIRTASHGWDEEIFFAPSNLTYTEACKWCRDRLRRSGWQDALVYVGP